MPEAAPTVGGGAASGRIGPAETADVDAEPPTAQFIRRVLKASRDVDPIELQAQLDIAARVFGLARCVDEIVMPASRRLLLLLGTGRCDPPQELMATEAIRTWLNLRGSFAPSPHDIGPILLACGPRDRHTVGLESLALLLRFRRWPCRVLGARISTFSLTVAAQAGDVSGVVVMSTEGRGRPHAIVSLRAVDALRIPVFFAGSAFRSRGIRRQLPGLYLGTHAEGASNLLINTLTPALPRRPASSHAEFSS